MHEKSSDSTWFRIFHFTEHSDRWTENRFIVYGNDVCIVCVRGSESASSEATSLCFANPMPMWISYSGYVYHTARNLFYFMFYMDKLSGGHFHSEKLPYFWVHSFKKNYSVDAWQLPRLMKNIWSERVLESLAVFQTRSTARDAQYKIFDCTTQRSSPKISQTLHPNDRNATIYWIKLGLLRFACSEFFLHGPKNSFFGAKMMPAHLNIWAAHAEHKIGMSTKMRNEIL